MASKMTRLAFLRAAIRDIVRYYTREAGVRSLDREISKICRKVVKELLTDQSKEASLAIAARKISRDAA